MPIRPENRALPEGLEADQPGDPRPCAAAVRCTGECGVQHFTDGALANMARNGIDQRTLLRPQQVTGSTVVLTVAHLDHQPEHCDPSNLKAMCQRCHRPDRRHHSRTAPRHARREKPPTTYSGEFHVKRAIETRTPRRSGIRTGRGRWAALPPVFGRTSTGRGDRDPPPHHRRHARRPRLGHMDVVALCSWHHRGVTYPELLGHGYAPPVRPELRVVQARLHGMAAGHAGRAQHARAAGVSGALEPPRLSA